MSNGAAEVHAVLGAIQAAWRNGHPSSMGEHLHPDIAMALPGFTGKVQGREILIASFAEFCSNARVLEYAEEDEQIDVAGDCAVATFRFRMLYARADYREWSEGRDFWVFARQNDGRWVATWRTMMDLSAKREPVEA
jgi:ketosteroid isomerase-like protein